MTLISGPNIPPDHTAEDLFLYTHMVNYSEYVVGAEKGRVFDSRFKSGVKMLTVSVWAVWCMPLIPALGRKRHANL